MLSFFERLDKFMEYKGLNDNRLTVETGISNGIIGKARKRGALSQDNISKLLYAYSDLNANWLLTGEGLMLKSENQIKDDNTVILSEGYKHYETNNYGIPKPFIDSIDATCGYPNGFSVAIMAKECENIIIPFMGDYDFSIRARGDSMINRKNPSRSIRERDIVVCKLWKSRTHIRWGEIYALATTEGVIVKKIMESDTEGHVKCVSFNTEDGYKPYDLPLEEIHDWAIVVGVASINTW